MSAGTTRIDVIAAVRNEAQGLPRFVARLRALPLPESVTLRLVFIEDSSTDATLEVLRDLAAGDPDIGYYALERGFGQGPAIVFGLCRSEADACILMDADGSHPPEIIPEMIERHLEGAGVVQCVRRELSDRRIYRRLATRLFQTFATWLVGIDLAEQSIYYRLVSRRFADQIVADPRYWRFLRFPLPRVGGELAKIPVDSAERAEGESKYGPMRLAGLAIDAVLSLMPGSRFGVCVGGGAALAALLVGAGSWFLGSCVAGVVVWVIRRHRALRAGDLLARMSIRETANTPEADVTPAFAPT